MRLLVCGGREYGNRFELFGELDALDIEKGVTVLIHGAARGADSIAHSWGVARGKTIERYPADWNKDGRAAGPLRNQRMLKEGKPDIVVAFPGGRGTAHMIGIAEAEGIEVRRVPLDA